MGKESKETWGYGTWVYDLDGQEGVIVGTPGELGASGYRNVQFNYRNRTSKRRTKPYVPMPVHDLHWSRRNNDREEKKRRHITNPVTDFSVLKRIRLGVKN